MNASQGALALLRAQSMIDAWAGDRLTLSRQLRTTFTLLNGVTAVTLGPAPATVVMTRPMFLNHCTYIIPGSSPPVENSGGIAIMDEDSYAGLTIKTLPSALPTQCFYQVNLDGINGTLTFWPQVTQNVDIVIYTPEAVGVPVSLNTVLTGPSGYQEAFLYQLAMRLATPNGVNVAEQCPMLPKMAIDAFALIKRNNVRPGILSVDPALVAQPSGGRYNVLTNEGG
jgi:hypothetical protein